MSQPRLTKKINLKNRNGGEPWTAEQLQRHLAKVHAEFRGTVDTLAWATGVAWVGHHYGWVVIRLCFAYSTLRKYGKILDIDWDEAIPVRTKLASDVSGVRIADGFEKFWQAMSGAISHREARVVGPELATS